MSTPDMFELVLRVKDASVAAKFYREVVGLEQMHDPDQGWASFWAGDKKDNRWLGLTEGALFFEEHSPRPEGQRFGPVHYAFKLRDSQKEASLQRLKSNGVPVYGPHVWESGRMEGASYYFYDPDDNLLEFWFPKP